MITKITSNHNPNIQQVRALLNQKSARSESGWFVVEGVRLSEETLSSGCLPTQAYYTQSISERGKTLISTLTNLGVDLYEVSDSVMESLTATETSQGILLVLSQEVVPLPPTTDFALVLDQVRDPGNLGTILRSAAAAGVKVVFLPSGTADAFAPKVVRAGMGAHFRLAIHSAQWPEILSYCRETCQPPLHLLLAESADGDPCWQVNLRTPLALVIGGEADGASQEAREAVDGLIHIPMPGKFESLNAAVAAGILLFEVVRQRSQP
ncbi:MAG: TrmH family RNA methyltransferase [Anaerolineaceae bacterium]